MTLSQVRFREGTDSQSIPVSRVGRRFRPGPIAQPLAEPSCSCVDEGYEAGGGSKYEEFVAECQGAVSEAGPYEWRIERLSFEGDTALVRLGGKCAGVWYSDDLSLVLIDDAWRIVHKTFYPHPAG